MRGAGAESEPVPLTRLAPLGTLSPKGRGFVVATRADIEAALTSRAELLVTAPGMAHAAGPAWFEQVLCQLTHPPPPIAFDVGDDAALAHTLCAAGRQVVFTGPQRFRAILAATFPGRVWRGIARSGRLR